MKADIKSTSSREQAAIAKRWEKAQNRLFLEDGFLTTVLEVMTKFNFEVRNAILTAVQRPDCHPAGDTGFLARVGRRNQKGMPQKSGVAVR